MEAWYLRNGFDHIGQVEPKVARSLRAYNKSRDHTARAVELENFDGPVIVPPIAVGCPTICCQYHSLFRYDQYASVPRPTPEVSCAAVSCLRVTERRTAGNAR